MKSSTASLLRQSGTSPSVWREWIEILCPSGRPSAAVSPSVWREWIEIATKVRNSPYTAVSPSVWREWIEMRERWEKTAWSRSPSVWREWIEMPYWSSFRSLKRVSLRVEGVD